MSHLETAKRFYQEAVKEFERGRKEGDEIRIRDSAEKAWNAVVQATNYLFQKKKLAVPTNHHDRRKALQQLTKIDPVIEGKALRDRYMARIGILHEDCFSEGVYDLALLEKDFQKVKKYIDDIEELAR